MASNNNVYTGNRTLLNASHLKRADIDNGTGQILWARDIDWRDISSDLTGGNDLTSLFIIQKLEELSSLSSSIASLSDRVTSLSSSITSLSNRVTALENQTPTPSIPVNPTLTINNPASTTIADGGSTTITVTSNVAGKLTLTTASGTGWSATSSSASTAATTHTITVTNLTATTTAGSIAAGGIVATFTPTDTTNYNTLTSQNVLKQAITLSAKPVERTKVTISNISVGSTTIADGSSMNIAFNTNANASISLATSSGTGWKATVTSSTGTSHTIKVENLNSVSTAGEITANTIKVTATPSDTANYLTSDLISIQTSVITLSAAAPQTTYYYYAGWTLPTSDNVDTIITETYPAENGSSIMHTAGKKTTSKSSIDYSSNKLYYANQKINYYVLVPTGHAIYDSLNNNVSDSTFTPQGNITVGNQTHAIYKSKATSRNINAIIIR